MAPKPTDRCSGCSYEHIGGGFVQPDRITEHTRLRIFGEAGGSEEERLGRGFVGPSGRKMRAAARKAGLACWSGFPGDPPPPRDEVAMANVVLCRPPGNNFPGKEVAWECRQRHPYTDWSGPNLAVGGNAIEALTGFALDPLLARGSIVPMIDGGWTTVTFHPAYLLWGKEDETLGKAMDDMEPLLALDCRRAVTTPAPVVPTVHVDWTGEEALAAFEAAKPTGLVSVDIEGQKGAPEVLGVGWEDGVAWAMPWTGAAKELARRAFKALPVFHNAEYDVPGIAATGIEPPVRWVDTIVLAAIRNPAIKKNLQTQVLTWVPGTTAWKGLVPHSGGVEARHLMFRAMWGEILRRLGRRVPDDDGWLFFYNGLDVAWTLALAKAQRRGLESEGRLGYYATVAEPIQALLIDMGQRGMPADPERIAFHRTACDRLVRMANRILRGATAEMLVERAKPLEALFAELEAEREAERANGQRAFSRAKELSSLRTKLRTMEAAVEEGFNFDSFPQRKALLYDWYGLPEVYEGRGADRHVTTNDLAIESLTRRMTRTDPFDEDGRMVPTIKPKRGTVEECVRVLRAVLAGRKWRTWSGNYLQLPYNVVEGRRPRVPSQYGQHQATTGRLASGIDTNDPEKGLGRGKIQQMQNTPRKLRDGFVPDPGYVMVGADWSGLQWALTMWYASKYDSDGYHLELLDKQQRGELDPHTFLATFVYGRPDVTQDQRRVVKGYTFGRIFQGTPIGLAREAGHPQAVGYRVCAAHDKAFRLGEWQSAVIAQAKQRHFVQTPLGWRIYFWSWKPKPNEVLADLIQATEGDLCKWVLGRMRMPAGWELLSSTHDSILIQVPASDEAEGKTWLRGQMEQSIPWLDGRGWRCAVKAGMSWRAVS